MQARFNSYFSKLRRADMYILEVFSIYSSLNNATATYSQHIPI